MIIFIGLVLLIAAVVVGVVGVLTNSGDEHAITDGFSVFGYDVTGSTGTLFLYGIVVGAVGLLGLALLFSGARRSSRKAKNARREAKDARRQATEAQHDRDRIAEQNSALAADSNAGAPAPRNTPAPHDASGSSSGATSYGAHERGARPPRDEQL
ncbi:hypothetical protein ACIBED_15320 [Rhodococcus coprophilus]|uniref:Uncharacterized protein n=1 Tax=Rhodococcus coprophilus TaxID=38310 RepID=A0A2X4U7U7_9NOCA|nr:hypothetical protein [Rhodococcus coprophilus]MBM7457819.1 hypothetical protein [Rhodococcus coprophilus]SQI30442.1 Uncharacterised protein [Rhodococcus coprophilus]